MDWGAPVLWPFTIHLEFCREGRVLMKATSWVGFIGIYTGMRVSTDDLGFSVSLNYRQVQGPAAIVKNFIMALRGAWPASLLLRRTLQDCTGGFAAAAERLRTEPLMAPCYLTLAGSRLGEGLVLERNRVSVDRCQALDAIWAAGAPRMELAPGVCVATNIDADVSDFDFSEGSATMQWAEGDALLMTALERRCVGVRLLEALRSRAKAEGRQFSPEEGLDLWATVPVCNDQTIYSCVLCPKTGLYEARVIFKWEEYCKGANAEAWDEWLATAAYDATNHLTMCSKGRGDLWPTSTK